MAHHGWLLAFALVICGLVVACNSLNVVKDQKLVRPNGMFATNLVEQFDQEMSAEISQVCTNCKCKIQFVQ